MSPIRKYIIRLIEGLPEEKLDDIVSFIQFTSQKPTELDDYDYEMAKRADKIMASEEQPILFLEACKELGIDISEL